MVKETQKNFIGSIIEESLEKKGILQKVKILKTKIETVTKEHKTPWIKKWTIHVVEVSENKADAIAKELSASLDSKHYWHVELWSDSHFYVIFPNKMFKVETSKREQYNEAKQYGQTLGIPEFQIDFNPEVKKKKEIENIKIPQ